MKGSAKGILLCVLGLAILGGGALVYKKWANKRKPWVDMEETVEVPFIFWGGDVATFHANGGLETKPDSIFGKLGLKFKLKPGDDFEKQVKDYLDGKSPFLRGTLSMLGQASEELTKKSETTPVVFLQLTWSAGDHLVGRESFVDLNNLKGKKIALQEGGPHVGMLNDILRTVRLDWNDITVVWTKDVTGAKGPAALFRKDKTIDGCFAISPDMFELTSAPESGGVTSVGDGSKKSIKGAHVVVSTAHMSRSIADVYACRKDFYEKNPQVVERFAAGFIKASEVLIDVKKKKENKDKEAEKRYKGMIKLAQDIWGKDDAIKDLVAKEDDVDGLISDASFVGLPGNETFFTAKGNLSGFEFKQQQALVLPADPAKESLKTKPKPFLKADLDYKIVREVGDLHGKAPTQQRFNVEKIEKKETIFTFKITFAADTSTFDAKRYGDDFQRALEQASLFGNAIVAIRGHATPVLLVQRFIQAGLDDGMLKRDGRKYLLDGKPLDLKDTKKILDVIAKNPQLRYRDEGGRGTMQQAVVALQDLSEKRAEEVRKSVVAYGKSKGLILEQSQLKPVGVGVTEPVEGYPQTEEESARNRRVEFSIVKVPADKVASDEFDL